MAVEGEREIDPEETHQQAVGERRHDPRAQQEQQGGAIGDNECAEYRHPQRGDGAADDERERGVKRNRPRQFVAADDPRQQQRAGITKRAQQCEQRAQMFEVAARSHHQHDGEKADRQRRPAARADRLFEDERRQHGHHNRRREGEDDHLHQRQRGDCHVVSDVGEETAAAAQQQQPRLGGAQAAAAAGQQRDAEDGDERDHAAGEHDLHHRIGVAERFDDDVLQVEQEQPGHAQGNPGEGAVRRRWGDGGHAGEFVTVHAIWKAVFSDVYYRKTRWRARRQPDEIRPHPHLPRNRRQRQF